MFKKITLYLWAFISFAVIFSFVAGFAGVLHPALDSFSHFRIYTGILSGIVLLIWSVLLRKYIWLLTALFVWIYIYWLARPFHNYEIKTSNRTFTHMQYNINVNNSNHLQDVVKYIISHNVDIVTLQEITHRQKESIEKLLEKTNYKWRAYCFRRTSHVAIISRHPFVEDSVKIVNNKGFVAAKIDMGGYDLSVVSIHLFLPFPFNQYPQMSILLPEFSKLKSPLLISGDFNAAPWSNTVQTIAKASNTKSVDGMRLTIPTDNHLKPYIPIPIDQVLVSSAITPIQITIGPNIGSDHWPVIGTYLY